jgi:hypothetical protein
MQTSEMGPVLASLKVSKLHKGKPVMVEFDRLSKGILDLPISGGETISW